MQASEPSPMMTLVAIRMDKVTVYTATQILKMVELVAQ